MDKLGKDLEATFASGKRTFPPTIAYQIALKVFDALEYIHDQGYAHNDIKAQNLLLEGTQNNKENKLYLVDFGLVSRYHRKGVHLPYEPDERKAHDGTIAYTSRDAHIGAHSRRSDLEMLGYNLVHWISGKLPWMDSLSNHEYVHMQKNGFMEDIRYLLSYCFDGNRYPEVLYDYLNYVISMEFDTTPDYRRLRRMFEDELKKERRVKKRNDFTEAITELQKKEIQEDIVLEIKSDPACSPLVQNRKRRHSEPFKAKFKFEVEDACHRKSPRIQRKLSVNESNDKSTIETQKASKTSRTRRRSSEDGKDDKKFKSSAKNETLLRTKRKLDTNEKEETNNPASSKSIKLENDNLAFNDPIDNWSWERVIGSGNCELSELLIDKDAINSLGEGDINGGLASEHQKLIEKEQKESLDNPTPAMKIIMKRLKEKGKKKEKISCFPQIKSPSFRGKSRMTKSVGGKVVKRSVSWDLTPNSLTPAMEEIMRKRSRRQFRRRLRHMSSDATEAKKVAIDISPSTETDNTSLDNMFDVKSFLPDSEEETLSTPKLTNDSKGKIPKIKSMNNQEFPKPGLNKLHGNFTLPTLRPRRKRSSTNTCVCM
jgi:serine/threonine protein kinase